MRVLAHTKQAKYNLLTETMQIKVEGLIVFLSEHLHAGVEIRSKEYPLLHMPSKRHVEFLCVLLSKWLIFAIHNFIMFLRESLLPQSFYS